MQRESVIESSHRERANFLLQYDFSAIEAQDPALVGGFRPLFDAELPTEILIREHEEEEQLV